MAEIAKKLWLNSLAQYLLLQAESKEENATQKVPQNTLELTSKGQKPVKITISFQILYNFCNLHTFSQIL